MIKWQLFEYRIISTNLSRFYFSLSLYFVSHLIKINFYDTFNFYKPRYLSQVTKVSLKLTYTQFQYKSLMFKNPKTVMFSVCLNKCRNFITHKWNLTRRRVKPWCICQRECMIWLHNWDLIVIRKKIEGKVKKLESEHIFSLLSAFLPMKLTFDRELSPSSDKWTTEMLSLVRWDASKCTITIFPSII